MSAALLQLLLLLSLLLLFLLLLLMLLCTFLCFVFYDAAEINRQGVDFKSYHHLKYTNLFEHHIKLIQTQHYSTFNRKGPGLVARVAVAEVGAEVAVAGVNLCENNGGIVCQLF